MQAFQRAKIRYLVKMADQFWSAAKLNWLVGMPHPALHNLNHAVELYLRAAWLTDQEFKDEETMVKELKQFSKSSKNKFHDFPSMLGKLPAKLQIRFMELDFKSFALVDDSVLRYGDESGFGYSDTEFYNVDTFIRIIREFLGYKNLNDDYEVIMNTVVIPPPRDTYLVEDGIKRIIRSVNHSN